MKRILSPYYFDSDHDYYAQFDEPEQDDDCDDYDDVDNYHCQTAEVIWESKAC